MPREQHRSGSPKHEVIVDHTNFSWTHRWVGQTIRLYCCLRNSSLNNILDSSEGANKMNHEVRKSKELFMEARQNSQELNVKPEGIKVSQAAGNGFRRTALSELGASTLLRHFARSYETWFMIKKKVKRLLRMHAKPFKVVASSQQYICDVSGETKTF